MTRHTIKTQAAKRDRIPDADEIARTVYAVDANDESHWLHALYLAESVEAARAYALGWNDNLDDMTDGFAWAGADGLIAAIRRGHRQAIDPRVRLEGAA